MTKQDFNTVVREQMNRCESLLLTKGKEYAASADKVVIDKKDHSTGLTELVMPKEQDRLLHFKKAAALINGTPKAALLGMLSKHLVSVSDMCLDDQKYSIDKWNEKITDSINYLLILRALVEEENNE